MAESFYFFDPEDGLYAAPTWLRVHRVMCMCSPCVNHVFTTWFIDCPAAWGIKCPQVKNLPYST